MIRRAIRPPRGVLVLGFSAGLALLAGCGGGDEEPAPVVSDEPAQVVLTRDELIAEADGVCAEVNAAIGTINSSESTDEATRAEQRADLYAGLADRLQTLGDPSDGSPPTEVISAATDLGSPDADDADLVAFQEAADEYGLSTCAEDPEAPSGAQSVSDDSDGAASTDDPASTPAPNPTPSPTPSPGTGGGAAPVTPGSGGNSSPSGGLASP